MGHVVLEIDQLAKRYRIGGPVEPYRTLRDTLAGLARAPLGRRSPDDAPHVWALDGVSSTSAKATSWASSAATAPASQRC